MRKIPLNSLVFLIDVSAEDVSSLFPAHEMMSVESVQLSMIGPGERPDLRGLFQAEMERVTFLRLALGQRVVIDAPDLKPKDRLAMAKTAAGRGFDVFYLVDDLNIRRDLVRGDRIANVVDMRRATLTVVTPTPDSGFFNELRSRGFSGVTVVPDVHGMMNPLRNAISWAKARNHFILFLGDLVDFGIDTLEVVDEVYQLVVRGEADALLGNHERKIFRYLSLKDKASSKMQFSDGNKVTIDRVNELSRFDYDRWVSRFKALVNMMRNHRVDGNFIFAHGAVQPEMWDTTAPRLHGNLESVSLFGEVCHQNKRDDGLYNRTYNWVDLLGPNQIAFVGHDIRSEFDPFTHKGERGGVAYFLDTGCGKGGHLSTLDLRFHDDAVRIENVNLH